MSKFFQFDMNVRNVFDDDCAKFTAFNKLMFDVAMGTLEDGVSKRAASDKIVKKFLAMIGCDEKSDKKAIRRAIRKNQALVFEVLEDTLQNLMITGWQKDPFFMDYVETRNLALGDTNEFYIPDESVMSVMELSGNHHSVIRQRLGAGTTTSVTTKWVGIKFYSEFERLLMNVEDFGTFITKLYEAHDNYIKQTIYDTMLGYSEKIPAAFKKTGSVTAENLRELCDTVSRVTGSKVIIMGTRAALRHVTALQNAEYISNDMKNEHYKTGTLGFWEGFELVELDQGFRNNDLTQELISNDMIWVMPVASNQFIKLVNEGDTQIDTIQDAGRNVDKTYSYELQTKMGIAVLFALAFGMYEIVA